MVANSFLQNPVGSHVENGVLRLDDFGALFGNPALTASLPHVIAAALVTGGFFVVGVSAITSSSARPRSSSSAGRCASAWWRR